MGVTDEARSSGPVTCSGQVVTVDELEFIKDLVIEGVVVHGIDDDSSLTVEIERILIDIDQDHQVFHNVHAGDVFG